MMVLTKVTFFLHFASNRRNKFQNRFKIGTSFVYNYTQQCETLAKMFVNFTAAVEFSRVKAHNDKLVFNISLFGLKKYTISKQKANELKGK